MKQRTQKAMEQMQEIAQLQQEQVELGVVINEKIVTLEAFLEGKKSLPKLGDVVAEKLNRTSGQKSANTKRRQKEAVAAKRAAAKTKTKKKKRRAPRETVEEREDDVIKAASSKKGITQTDARKIFGGSAYNKECDKFLRRAKKDKRLVLRTVTTKNSRGRKQTGPRWFAA